MKTKKKLTSLSLFIVFVLFGLSNTVHASQVPSLALYPSTGSSIVQVNIIGADPNAPASLHYQSGSTIQTIDVGSTNNIGYLNTTLDSATYNIAVGSQTYAIVNGQASPSIPWPNYTTGGSLSLSQTNLILSAGQNVIVVASVSAPLTIASNSNSAVASATISSNQINISALSVGTTKISVCASGIGCSTISVNVASQGMATSASVYINQNSASITVGQSLAVGISGSGGYYISSNSNPGVAVAIINGPSLTVTGNSAGTTVISLCASTLNGSSNTCIPLTITVTAVDTTTAGQSTTKTISFSANQVTLSQNQNQNITIFGSASGMFSVGSNSNPTSVGASTNGNILMVSGVAPGGSNISVCEYGGVCGNVYAYVNLPGSVAASSVQTNTTITAPTTSAPTPTTNSSISNHAFSNYLYPGLTSPDVTALQNILIQKGYLSHPATGYYGLLTAKAVIKLQSANGIQALGVVGPATRALLNSSSTTSAASTNNFTFSNPLYFGMTNTDVTALQKKLTSLGVYSGPITGYYGSLTKNAVEAYQTKKGLTPLGNVGPATRSSLNSD